MRPERNCIEKHLEHIYAISFLFFSTNMIFIDYLQFWVEKGIKQNTESQNLRNGRDSSEKNKLNLWAALFSIQNKNSFIEAHGKNVPSYKLYYLLH